jgi:proteasome accessory factor A
MIEAGEIRPDLALEDPIEAAVRFSHDLGLSARAALVSGRMLSSLELQRMFFAHAARVADRGVFDGIVPEWEEILRLWGTTLDLLEAGDLDALARRLDWALKLKILLQALGTYPRLDWTSAEIKHLDQAYSSLDPAQGLYWNYEREGLVERVVPQERVEWFMEHPPEDTRAWTRAMLLRRAGAEAVNDVDWDFVRARAGGRLWTVKLDDPYAGKSPATAAGVADGGDLEDVLVLLGAKPVGYTGAPSLEKCYEEKTGGNHEGTKETAN